MKQRLFSQNVGLRRQTGLISLTLVAVFCGAVYGQTSLPSRTMSYSNRQLFNRAVVEKLNSIEVMLLAQDGKFDDVKRAATADGATVLWEDLPTGYLRVRIATAKLTTLVADPAIAAYQIATNANMIWDQEGRSEAISNMYRRYETRPLGGDPFKPNEEVKKLPLLTVPESRADGYTAGGATGVSEWLSQHPSWDGRGVTIAMLETALPEFTHPTLRTAKALDGKDVPKIAGIINTVDPKEQDFTLVDMKTTINSTTEWYAVDGRTYILPHPGKFQFGIFSAAAGGNLYQGFAVLWDQASGEIWVDTDGDDSFKNEKPMHDVNQHLDTGYLQLTYPDKKKLEFVVAKGQLPDTLHLYPSRGGHQAMTASVAAGSRTPDGLAFGVAPNARVMFVRNQTSAGRASDFIEGYIDIEKRPDVDILSDSRGLVPVPDMSSEFYGMIFGRIIKAYHKPIFHSGGNDLPSMGSASGLPGVFSVGGSISPATYAALFGGGTIDKELKHPLSSEGPAGDGAMKPDFLAPMHRISADVCVGAYAYGAPVSEIGLPKNAPKVALPACYQISCCTSASGPYAAGMAAILESAARQEKDPFTLDSLGRALRDSAHFLPGTPAFAQGAGVLNVEGAWKDLQEKVPDPQIKISGPLVYPMVEYAQHPNEGKGLLEVSGWAPGQSGNRTLHLKREAGPQAPVTYRISWTGNDGTFQSPSKISLPLNTSVALPLKITVGSYGPHSAILNIHDPQSDAVIAQTLATIVAPQPIAAAHGDLLKFDGSIPLMQSREFYVSVPAGTQALKIEINIKQGSLSPTFRSMDPSQNVPNRTPNMFRTLNAGMYTYIFRRPSSGTWLLSLANDSGWRQHDLKEVTTDEANYELTASALTGTVEAKQEQDGKIALQLSNAGASLIDPVADVYSGSLISHRDRFSADGEPKLIEVNAPEGTGVLRFSAKSGAGASDLELYLYDCTSGECFFSDYAGPAAPDAVIAIHNPKAGKWVLAVNAAPAMAGHGDFVVNEFIGGKASRQELTTETKTSVPDQWKTTVDQPKASSQPGQGEKAFLCELVDASLERAELEREHAIPPLQDEPDKAPPLRPVAVATTVLQ